MMEWSACKVQFDALMHSLEMTTGEIEALLIIKTSSDLIVY